MGQLIEFLIMKGLVRLFPKRYRLIPGLHGQPLLRQFKLNRWAYLQSFVIPEGLEYFHVHRWELMISFVLCGKFVEERYPGGMFLEHKGPSVYRMDKTVIHRLHHVEPRTWTLFLMLNDEKDWGYFPRPTDTNYTPWDKMIPPEKRVDPL